MPHIADLVVVLRVHPALEARAVADRLGLAAAPSPRVHGNPATLSARQRAGPARQARVPRWTTRTTRSVAPALDLWWGARLDAESGVRFGAF